MYCATCTTCEMLLPVSATAHSLWANLRGVKLRLYWFFTALISWWRFKLLKALYRIVLNSGQGKNGGIFDDQRRSPWDSRCLLRESQQREGASVQHSVPRAAWFLGSHGKALPQNRRTIFYSRFRNAVYCKPGVYLEVVSNWHSQVELWRHSSSYSCPQTSWQRATKLPSCRFTIYNLHLISR